MQGNRTTTAVRLLSKWGVFGAIVVGSLGCSGCATQAASRYSPEAVAAMSPRAQEVGPFEALRLATKYVADNPGTGFLVGSGDSMLPLYKDRTVVVTQRIAMSDLRAGMTAVYIGESGKPVAHVLVKRTSIGWLAMGVGNADCDVMPVTQSNLVGIVIKAYQPSGSPLVALLNESASKSAFASMP
jgi:hypothetical protein